jgi:hypothetical protein
LQRSDRC